MGFTRGKCSLLHDAAPQFFSEHPDRPSKTAIKARGYASAVSVTLKPLALRLATRPAFSTDRR